MGISNYSGLIELSKDLYLSPASFLLGKKNQNSTAIVRHKTLAQGLLALGGKAID
jgi:hypothetical protein